MERRTFDAVLTSRRALSATTRTKLNSLAAPRFVRMAMPVGLWRPRWGHVTGVLG